MPGGLTPLLILVAVPLPPRAQLREQRFEAAADSGQRVLHLRRHLGVGGADLEAQARQAFSNLATVLRNAGSGLEHVVKVTILVTDMTVIDQVVTLRREYFTPPYPADTIAQVVSLAQPEWQIEIEAVAVVPDPR